MEYIDIFNGNPDYTANQYHHFSIRHNKLPNITQKRSELLVASYVGEVMNFIRENFKISSPNAR